MLLFRESLPNLNGNIRILHAAPGISNVDVYLDGDLLINDLAFSKYTNYIKLSPGKYSITIFTSGTNDNPILTSEIELIPNTNITFSIVFLENKFILFKLEDYLTTSNEELSYLRFINLSPNGPLLSVSLPNGNTLISGIEYLETIGYYSLSPGIYNFILTATNDKLFERHLNPMELKNSTFTTVYVIGLVNNIPQLGYLVM